MRRIAGGATIALAAVALGLVLVGVPTLVLQAPWFTRALVTRYYEPSSAGLPLPQALLTAEQVRAYTTDPAAAPLPAEVGGRPAFDESAASHLRDVRRVLEGALALTLASAALLAALLAFALPARRSRAIAFALGAGALGTLAIATIAAAWAAADFERFFAAFHGLFFSAGTWTFSEGTLLIELFPEPLWAAFGALWAAGVLLGAGLALLAARALLRRNRGQVAQEV